jgi:hypothetical protein
MSLLNLLILIIEKSSNLIILVFLTMLLCSLQIFLEIVGYNQNTKSKFYKGIDFWKDGLGISVKTTNATTEAGQASTIATLKKNIDDLVGMRAAGLHPDDKRTITNVQLMIITPDSPGYNTDWLQQVYDYARERQVEVLNKKL